MKKVLLSFVILLILVALGLWVTGYGFVFKTLVYTFPDIDDLEIFEKRIIPNGQPEELPVSVHYNQIQLPAAIDSENVLNESVAFLVMKNDSIVYEKYWDGYDQSSVSNSFSVAKSIVGILIGIAADEKIIDLYEPVGKYIPAFSKPPNDKLQIIDVLRMTSGLNWNESYQSLFSTTTEAYYGSNLEKQVEQLKVINPTGRTFNYMSCNSLLLGMVISKASGKTLSEYASEKLWKPLGANNPAYWSIDHEDGVEKSYCCFYSTARDFARVGQLILDSGRWHGRQIVSENYVLHSIAPNAAVDESGSMIDYYGWHWWLSHVDGRDVCYARGILGQYIIVIPSEDMVIVRLGKKRGTKIGGNQYSDMVSYTSAVLNTFGNSLDKNQAN